MTGSGMRPLDRPCSEQGKQPIAKAFKLAERDKHMSEQEKPKSFFWRSSTGGQESTVVAPLFASETGEEDWELAIERVKKAIRQKVLESYRNGQAMGRANRRRNEGRAHQR
jgi:hypothetical protein